MIKVENTKVYGWEEAIRGMRNPLNSWDKSDSERDYQGFWIGENDKALMQRLNDAGTDHGKFMRMIAVYVDITAPLYWWKEFDTYKVGTVANSCSTMHKIQAKEFAKEDFSCEHFDEVEEEWLNTTLTLLNWNRDKFNETKDKIYWWHMIQMLPTSYNQKRTVMLNYAVLKNMYHSRKNHKLDEWRDFCEWMKSLTMHHLITGE